MRLRGLLIASAALLVLGGLVWWSEKSKTAEGDAPKADESPVILSLKPDDIKRVEIRRKSGETTVIEREGSGAWTITQPKPLAADPDAVTSFLTALGSLKGDKLVDEKTADFGPFGLNDPSITVTATSKDGKTHTVMVGDPTPGSGGSYVRADGSKRLLTIADFTRAGVDKTAADLRDKRLLTFGRESLTKVELTAKNQTVEFGRNAHGDWQMVKPLPARADGWQVDELLRKLGDAKLDATAGDETLKKNESVFASAAPVATARLTDKLGTQSFEVRKTQDGLLVKSSAVPGVHALAAAALQGVDKTAAEFRSKKVFDFGFTDPTKVEFTDAGKTRVFTKSADKWAEGGKTMDSIAVQSLIDRLRDLTAAGFPASGFTQPEFKVTVQAGSRTETVSVSKSGDKWIARREGEPSLYELARPDVDTLRQAASDVKPSQPKPPEKK